MDILNVAILMVVIDQLVIIVMHHLELIIKQNHDEDHYFSLLRVQIHLLCLVKIFLFKY